MAFYADPLVRSGGLGRDEPGIEPRAPRPPYPEQGRLHRGNRRFHPLRPQGRDRGEDRSRGAGPPPPPTRPGAIRREAAPARQRERTLHEPLMTQGSRYRIGIDVGGTFTDLVLIDVDTGDVSVAKILNRHDDRGRGHLAAARPDRSHGRRDRLDQPWHHHRHQCGDRTKGRENRPSHQPELQGHPRDWPIRTPAGAHLPGPRGQARAPGAAPSAPRRHRPDRPPRQRGDRARRAGSRPGVEGLAERRVESVAVRFLFSFLDPVHEERARHRLEAALPGVDVVLSSEILREFREFPRTSTTVFAAYVAPVLRSYISGLIGRMSERGISCPLYMFQSSGGVATPEIVMRNPAATLLSGPPGAVVGAAHLCGEAGFHELVTMDIGGMGPGSYSPATSDIHQEGMFIPPVKPFEAGQPNSGVLEMIMANIRNRSIGSGDLRAQYASCETAERRLEEVRARYGFGTVKAAMEEIIARAERMTRARIAEFSDGDYHARDCLDGDGRSPDKTWIDVRIRIRGSDIVADLTGSSDQSSGGMNCSHSAAASAVQYAVKSLTDPENPPNAGSYRPIAVRTRPGSLVDARKPGSMIGFGDVRYRVLDTTMAALAGAVGDLGMASGSGSTGTVVVAGRRPPAVGGRRGLLRGPRAVVRRLWRARHARRDQRDPLRSGQFRPYPHRSRRDREPALLRVLRDRPRHRRCGPVPRRQRFRARLPRRVRPSPALPVRGPPRDASTRPVRRTARRDGTLCPRCGYRSGADPAQQDALSRSGARHPGASSVSRRRRLRRSARARPESDRGGPRERIHHRSRCAERVRLPGEGRLTAARGADRPAGRLRSREVAGVAPPGPFTSPESQVGPRIDMRPRRGVK